MKVGIILMGNKRRAKCWCGLEFEWDFSKLDSEKIINKLTNVVNATNTDDENTVEVKCPGCGEVSRHFL